jgi:hypothetical protein
MCFARPSLHTNVIAFKECIALAVGFEMNAKLGIDNIAHDYRAFASRFLQRIG